MDLNQLMQTESFQNEEEEKKTTQEFYKKINSTRK